MSSGRKFSVQRHIGNYNIHNGQGKVIPFVEYAIGRTRNVSNPGAFALLDHNRNDFGFMWLQAQVDSTNISKLTSYEQYNIIKNLTENII